MAQDVTVPEFVCLLVLLGERDLVPLVNILCLSSAWQMLHWVGRKGPGSRDGIGTVGAGGMMYG